MFDKINKLEPKVTFIFKIMYLLLTLFSFNNLTVYTSGLRIAALFMMIFGCSIILYRILHIRKYIQSIGATLLALFLLSYVFSSFMNMSYGVVENIKALVWMTILFVVVYLTDQNTTKELLIRELKIIHVVTLVYITMMNIVGIIMFFLDFGYEFGRNGLGVHYGWLIGRLMGMYSDANYMAVISCVSLVVAFYLLILNRNLWVRITLLFSSVVNVIYIALSDSRTGLVALACTTFVLAFLLLKRSSQLINRKPFSRLFLSFVIAFILMLVSFGAIQLVLEGARLYKSDVGREVSTATLFIASTSEITTEVGRELPNNDITTGRLGIWGSAIDLFQSSPIFGVSFRNILAYAEVNTPDTFILNNDMTNFPNMHNLLLDVLVSQGIIGIVIFLILVVYLIIFVLKGIHQSKEIDYFVLCIGLSTLVPIVVSTMFYSEILFINTSGSVLFWLTLGAITRYLMIILRGESHDTKEIIS